MTNKDNNLLISASGTGGHIFPALTLAESVDNDWRIIWLGIRNRCEVQLVPKKYNLHLLNFSAPQKKRVFLILQYIRIILSTFQVIKIIRRQKIKLVFTTGGYISAPTIIAARLLNIPIMLHESNLVPGSVSKYFGCFCDFVLTGFKETNSLLNKSNVIFTGTPLRSQFYKTNLLPNWVPKGDGPLILVMGGSQGAAGINRMLLLSLDFLLKNNFRVVHIRGESQPENIKNNRSDNYVQIDFSNEIAALMQNCDLVISRAGSGAINELMQTKKPSILIPYPYSKNNHQEKNALFLSSAGGSILLNESINNEDLLKKTLKRIFQTLPRDKNNCILNLMSQNMKEIKISDPRKEIIKIMNQFKNDC